MLGTLGSSLFRFNNSPDYGLSDRLRDLLRRGLLERTVPLRSADRFHTQSVHQLCVDDSYWSEPPPLAVRSVLILCEHPSYWESGPWTGPLDLLMDLSRLSVDRL
jgi:hypothetical protein